MPVRLPALPARTAAALACAALLVAGSARAETFPAGTLVMPTQNSYQDACGLVSTYGLVYNVLRANDGLRANPSYASGAFQTPVTIHWVYKADKGSPNRCVPTNLDAVYAGKTSTVLLAAAAAGPVPDGYSGVYNDGCDFYIKNTSGIPASLVNNNSTAAANDSFSWSTINTNNTLGAALAYPNYKSRMVKYDATTATNVSLLQFMGGAFLVSASDAPAFLALLSGTVTTKDNQGNAVDFTAFRTTGACGVTTSGSGSTLRATFTATLSGEPGNAYANIHYVKILRAQVPFAAQDNQRINAAPPKIGLLQSIDRDYADENGSSVLGRSYPGIKGSQLRFYLRSAGLDYGTAGGCPSDGWNAGYSGAAPWTGNQSLCPAGKGVSGQIYDNLDIIDLKNDLINANDSNGKPRYSIIWAPHWDGNNTPTTNCDASCIQDAYKAIAKFETDTINPRGVLAECASIGAFEGSFASDGTTMDYNNAYSGLQALTCQESSAGSGKCGSPSGSSPAPIGLKHDMGNSSSYLPNCTNPDNASGIACVQFGSPGNPFSQVGDARWFSYSGAVSNYTPASGAIYQPGSAQVLPIVYTVNSLDTTTILTNPRPQAQSDNVTFIQRDNNKRKAQIIYLGGHNYTPDVAGTRIALNTMLSLGLVIDITESAFVGPTVYNSQVVVPTYYRVTSQAIPISWSVFEPSSPAPWQFPYHAGNLRVHNIASLTAGTSNAYGATASLVYTAVMPAPASRNLFTYLGGRVSATDGELSDSYKSTVGTGALQIGWKPVDVDAVGGLAPSAGCVDGYHIGPVTRGSITYAGMVPGSNDVCDLQESLALSIKGADLGSDSGASEQTAIVNKLSLTSEVNLAKWLLQMVRGFCFATDPATGGPKNNPSLSDCDLSGVDNVATFGGFVHSQAAVIPATALIPDAPVGKHRPTVVYVGGYDGQLHALYLPSDGNDVGYTGPLNTNVTMLSRASGYDVFHTQRGGTIPLGLAGLTELWAFIPPGQLPLLKTNQARVDSSPAVSDVFGDFDGSGKRTWHTVLVASAGGSNREIFALDVTNPLKPVLLWDIQSTYDSSLYYAPSSLQDDDTGKYNAATKVGSPRGQAFNWQNTCRALDSATCRAANYVLPPTDDDCDNSTPKICGRTISGLYNYAHLGASQSVSVGTLRRNNAPVFAAFVATNEPGGNGMYVFAIDMVTGQKIWEWNNPYDPVSYQSTQPAKFDGVGNTPPVGVSIVSRSLDDQINSLYVGDDEGSLWELDASSGVNNTAYAIGIGGGCLTSPGLCNYALSEAYGDGSHSAQPISTLATLFVVRPDIPTASLFRPYIGQTLLAYGTGGTDKVSSITTSVVSGAVHMLPVSPTLRDTAADIKADVGTTKKTHATSYGVSYEVAKTKGGSGTTVFPQYLSNGDRVFGSIVADLVTGKLYFGTTTGSVSDIDKRGALSGSLYQLDTTATTAGAAASVITTGIGGVGGTLGVSYDSNGAATLIASTDKDIRVGKPTGGGLAASATKPVYTLDGTDSGAQGLLGWILRRSGRVY